MLVKFGIDVDKFDEVIKSKCSVYDDCKKKKEMEEC